MLAYPFGQAKAINGAGHFDIAENNIHDISRCKSTVIASSALTASMTFIAAVPQVLCDGDSHQNVILHNKDRFLNCGRIGHLQ